MKEPYIWNYNIKIKTKDGEYEYEQDDVLDAVKLVEKHPDYEEFYMEHKPKALVKRRLNDTKRSTGATTETRQ